MNVSGEIIKSTRETFNHSDIVHVLMCFELLLGTKLKTVDPDAFMDRWTATQLTKSTHKQ